MYYVYLLIDPRTSLPFYVGKGKNKRAEYHIVKNKQGKGTENPYKDRVIREILAEGLTPTIEYTFWSTDEKTAYDYEEDTIKKYGRKRYDPNGILTNLCEDNRPPHNEYSEERKNFYKSRMLGNKISAGRIHSQEEKIKRSTSLLNAYKSGKRKVTDEMRETISRTHKGKIVSLETKQKQSNSAKISMERRKGKTIEEIFGVEKANEIRNKKKLLPAPNRKEITINNKTYSSIREAAQALQISEYKAKKLNDSFKK
jgi:hypothetical protein